jgi:hypothetical protein
MAGTVRLVFFARTDGGLEGFVDPDHSSFGALAKAPLVAPVPLEGAIAELAQFLLAPRPNDDYGEGDEAVKAVDSADTLSSIAVLLTCAKDGRNPNHFDALGALLERNNLDALAIAEPLFLGVVPPASVLEYAASGLEGIDDVRAIPALAGVILELVGEVRTALERVPPELTAGISDLGLVLTGPVGLLEGLDRRLMHDTGTPMSVWAGRTLLR